MSATPPPREANPARPVAGREDVVIHRDATAYASHPCVTHLAGGDYLVAFCETLPRRPYLHPPSAPRFVNLIARSRDGGVTWEAPRVAPGHDWTGMQCPGLAQLSTGEVLLSQWQFRWLPLEAVRRLAQTGDPRPFLVRAPRTASDWERAGVPWARYEGGCFVRFSRDAGATWDETVRVETAPYPRGYSPRPVAELPDGALLLALGSEEDDTAGEHQHPTAAFVVRSADRGRTWGPPVAAIPAVPGRWVNEPALLPLPDGRLLLVARERGQHLVSTESGDGGRSWAPPAVTPIWGFPAHALLLRDGRVLCVYGHRRRPYGVRACLSEDGGRSWRYDDERVIRDDLRNGNCGYPTAVQDPDGSLFVAYSAEDEAGVTHVLGSRFRL